MMPSTLHERTSLIRCQIPIARQRIGMTLLHMTPRHLDTLRWLTGSAVEHPTAVELINACVVNDARNTARQMAKPANIPTPLQTMPSLMMTGGVM